MGQPEVSGDSATAICTRTLNFRAQTGALQTSSERVRLNLIKDGTGWLIRSIELN